MSFAKPVLNDPPTALHWTLPITPTRELPFQESVVAPGELRKEVLKILNQFENGVERQAARAMMQLAQRSPGASFRELLRCVPTGEIRSRNIKIQLIQEGVLAEESILGALRIFPGYLQEAPGRRQITALRDLDTLRLYHSLQDSPCCQGNLFKRTEKHGWSRTKTRRCLEKLKNAGLAQRYGKNTRYPTWTALKPHPSTLELSNSRGPIIGFEPIRTL